MPLAELARRDGVELARTGVWPTSTGEWNPTPADFAAAVAALNCPALDRPVLKIGHTDKRFTPGDGEPAIGRVENMRVGDGGHTLLGDYVGVPAWLDGIMASAYPRRSIEGYYNWRCTIGHTHPFVIRAVSLLGVTEPAVGTLQSLQDVAALYGVNAAAEVPEGATAVQATVSSDVEDDDDVQVPNVILPVAAAGDEKLRAYWLMGEGAQKIRWGTPGDFKRCVRQLRKYVRDPEGLCNEYHFAATGMYPGDRRNLVKATAGGGAMPDRARIIREKWNATQPHNTWIVEIAEDGSHIVVVNDDDRSFARVPVLASGDSVAFGTPVKVRPGYVEQVAGSVVFASREESRPDVQPSPDTPPVGETTPVDDPAAPAPPQDTPAQVEQPAPDGGPQSPAAEPEQPNTEPEEDPVSDLSEIARGLGLPDGASREDILAAISARDAKPEQPDTEPQPPAEPVEEPTPADQPAEQEPSREAELVAAMADMKAEIARLSQEVAASKAEKAATVRASVIDGAVKAGKIAPSERQEWERRYDRAPDVATEILASIAPGTAVPVMASGVTGPAEPVVDEDAAFERMVAALDGPMTTKGV